MKFSLCIEPIFEDLCFYDRIRKAKELGCDAIEMWDPWAGGEIDPKKIGDTAAQVGIDVAVTALHMDVLLQGALGQRFIAVFRMGVRRDTELAAPQLGLLGQAVLGVDMAFCLRHAAAKAHTNVIAFFGVGVTLRFFWTVLTGNRRNPLLLLTNQLPQNAALVMDVTGGLPLATDQSAHGASVSVAMLLHTAEGLSGQGDARQLQAPEYPQHNKKGEDQKKLSPCAAERAFVHLCQIQSPRPLSLRQTIIPTTRTPKAARIYTVFFQWYGL